MTQNIVHELRPRIVVFGVGGAGGNAVNNMIASDLQGVEFVAANTDSQALSRNNADLHVQLGAGMTQGLGAGGRPEIGRQAAEESLDDIKAAMENAHMVFITAGMGGGTGTGAAPVIARAAHELGVLTVAVVTKPFDFEGDKRTRIADFGVAELEEQVDTLIVIPNQNLFRIATEKTTIAEAFMLADEVLHSGVRGVTDLMTRPGIINLDFADVRTVMNAMGKAMMGTGEAGGERRAIEASHAAIANPLLDDVTLKGARAVLINITGGSDLTLFEVDAAANEIRSEVDDDADIIVGSALDDTLDGRVRVSVVATGIDPLVFEERRPREDVMAAHLAAQSLSPRPMGEAIQSGDMPTEPALRTRSKTDAEPVEERGGRGFGLFGRRGKEADTPPPLTNLDEEADADTLEIPAFLRRQANAATS